MSRVAEEVAAILRGAADHVRDRWRPYAVVMAAAALATPILLPRDAAILAAVREAGAGWQQTAELLSRIGRFENSTLLFAVGAALIAMLSGSRRWRDAAVACLLAGLVAGLAVNVLRPGFGRARPHAAVEPGFYWLELEADLHSMPSGHATSNSASAAALLPVLPLVGVPATLYALGVGWSRLQLNRHYPSDVMWGTVLGGAVGIAVGVATRDRRRRARSRSNGPG